MKFGDFVSESQQDEKLVESHPYRINDFEKGTARQQKVLKAFIEAADALEKFGKLVNWHTTDLIDSWYQDLSDNDDIPEMK